MAKMGITLTSCSIFVTTGIYYFLDQILKADRIDCLCRVSGNSFLLECCTDLGGQRREQYGGTTMTLITTNAAPNIARYVSNPILNETIK